MSPETTPDRGFLRHNYPEPVQTTNPAPLTVAASLTAIEGGLIAALGVLETTHLSSARVTMGVTTAIFFVFYGLVLMLCAWLVTRRVSWARAPIVLAQLIQILVGWGFRGGATTWVTVFAIVVAVVVILGLLNPASIDALADRPEE